ILQDDVGVAENRAKQIVEIVCHAAGEPAHSFELLRLTQLLLRFREGILGPPLFFSRRGLLQFSFDHWSVPVQPILDAEVAPARMTSTACSSPRVPDTTMNGTSGACSFHNFRASSPLNVGML